MRRPTEPEARKGRGAPAIAISPAARSPGRLIHDAHVHLRAGLIRTLHDAGHDLSPEGWAVLSLLWERDELSQLQIGERVGKDRHHTSKLLDTLEATGLVARTSTEKDRRVKLVRLTRAGRAARPRLARAVTRYLEATFDGVGQGDYDAFLRCLVHVVSRLRSREGAPEGARPRGASR